MRFPSSIEYKNYYIVHNPKPIPDFRFDYDFWHDGYDGADDSKDIRMGTGGSVKDCIKQIDDIIKERYEINNNQ